MVTSFNEAALLHKLSWVGFHIEERSFVAKGAPLNDGQLRVSGGRESRRGLALRPRNPASQTSALGEIHQYHVGALLRSFKHQIVSVGGDVKIANIKIVREVGPLALFARLQIH